MSRSVLEAEYNRLFRGITPFWLLVIAGLFIAGIGQTLSQHPHLLTHPKGWLIAALIVADAGWFLFMLLLRHLWRAKGVTSLSPHFAFAVTAPGLLLTGSLVLLQGAFLSLLFADIGITVFAVEGWWSFPLVGAASCVFLYEVAGTRSISVTDGIGDVLSIVSIVALVYSMRTVTRQRAERDRLIDELRTTNEQLREAHDQLRQAHARDVELAALRERTRLARDMHDSLGHALVLIAIKIEAAQRLQGVDPERAAEQWEETKALVRATMAELRTSLAGLRVPALEEHPLGAALRDLASELERTAGVTVTLQVTDAADMLERPVQEALYRVVQEALANVAKHAQAHIAAVRLDVRGERVCLEVVDDGVGLAAERPKDAHYGITGMRERIETLGGTLTVGLRNASGTPGAGQGTVVRASIPIQEPTLAGYSHPAG